MAKIKKQAINWDYLRSKKLAKKNFQKKKKKRGIDIYILNKEVMKI